MGKVDFPLLKKKNSIEYLGKGNLPVDDIVDFIADDELEATFFCGDREYRFVLADNPDKHYSDIEDEWFRELAFHQYADEREKPNGFAHDYRHNLWLSPDKIFVSREEAERFQKFGARKDDDAVSEKNKSLPPADLSPGAMLPLRRKNSVEELGRRWSVRVSQEVTMEDIARYIQDGDLTAFVVHEGKEIQFVPEYDTFTVDACIGLHAEINLGYHLLSSNEKEVYPWSRDSDGWNSPARQIIHRDKLFSCSAIYISQEEVLRFKGRCLLPESGQTLKVKIADGDNEKDGGRPLHTKELQSIYRIVVVLADQAGFKPERYLAATEVVKDEVRLRGLQIGEGVIGTLFKGASAELDKISPRKDGARNKAASTDSSKKPFSAKELQSIHRIIAILASIGGFDFKKLSSDTDVVGCVAKELGLRVGKTTICKILKEAKNEMI